MILWYIIVVFVLLYVYFTRNFNHWKNKGVPFIKPLPFFGNMIDGITMSKSFGETFSSFYKTSKERVLGIYIMDKPCLFIRDPEIIQRILITDFQYFYDRNVMNNERDDPISTNVLFVLKNPSWKEVRSKITPIYTTAKMKAMSQLIGKAAGDMITYLCQTTDDKTSIDIKDMFIKYTVDVITSAAFGVDAKSFENKNSQFHLTAKKLLNWNDFIISFRFRCYFMAHSLVKLFRLKFLDPSSVKFLEESFWDILEARAISKNHRNDLIDILLQMKNEDNDFLARNTITGQAVMFFVAGFETSSSALVFALYELAQQQEIQIKLRNEINEITKKHGGINYDSIKEMKYLEMCFKEVLRKYPILPVLDRSCNTTYTIPETGTVIDKGTAVFISLLGLQHDPQYFPNPEVFDPDRFSEENIHKVKNCTYSPFGKGPRNCIGARFGQMTFKYGLINILQKFNVMVNADTEKQIKFNPRGLVLSSLHPIKLTLKRIYK